MPLRSSLRVTGIPVAFRYGSGHRMGRDRFARHLPVTQTGDRNTRILMGAHPR